MNIAPTPPSSQTTPRPQYILPVDPVNGVANGQSKTATGTESRPGDSHRSNLHQRVAKAVTPAQRMRIETEWHAASLSVVHRILDPDTGLQIQQLPVAQVLDLVDDLMQQIQKG